MRLSGVSQTIREGGQFDTTYGNCSTDGNVARGQVAIKTTTHLNKIQNSDRLSFQRVVAAPASSLPLLAPLPAVAHVTYLFSSDAPAVRPEIVSVREVIWGVGEASEGGKQSKRVAARMQGDSTFPEHLSRWMGILGSGATYPVVVINRVQSLGTSRDPSPSQIHGTSSRGSRGDGSQFSRESTFYLYFVKVESGFSRNSSVSGWSPTETSELESKTSRGITTLKM